MIYWQRWNWSFKNLFHDDFIFSLLRNDVGSFSRFNIEMAERRITRPVSEENRFDEGKVASSDIATVTNSSINHLFQMFFIDSLQNEEFSWGWNWVNCTTVELWQDWFSPIKQRFSFLFHPIDEETNPMFDLLLESNVRHENEENFSIQWRWGKEKIHLFIERRQNIWQWDKICLQTTNVSSAIRIGVWWTRQWKVIQWKQENIVIRRVFIV